MEEKRPFAAAEQDFKASNNDQKKREQVTTPGLRGIFLGFAGSLFLTPASPRIRRCPRLLIWAIRAAIVSALLYGIYLQQLANKNLDIEKRTSLIWIGLLASTMFGIYVLLFSCVEQVVDFEGHVSREKVVKAVKVNMSLMFIDLTHSSTFPERPLLYSIFAPLDLPPIFLKYEDLDEKTGEKISKATAALASYLADPKHELMSYFSISHVIFHCIIHLLVYWIFTVFYFRQFWFARHDLWDFVLAMLPAIVYGFCVYDAFHLGVRLVWARLARDIRMKYILADLENGEGDFRSSVDWWVEELSKNAFEEIEIVIGRREKLLENFE
jgi:hypothetical protein